MPAGVAPIADMGRENLCDAPLFTGYTVDGGYAEYCIAHTDFVFPLPEDPTRWRSRRCSAPG